MTFTGQFFCRFSTFRGHSNITWSAIVLKSPSNYSQIIFHPVNLVQDSLITFFLSFSHSFSSPLALKPFVNIVFHHGKPQHNSRIKINFSQPEFPTVSLAFVCFQEFFFFQKTFGCKTSLRRNSRFCLI